MTSQAAWEEIARNQTRLRLHPDEMEEALLLPETETYSSARSGVDYVDLKTWDLGKAHCDVEVTGMFQWGKNCVHGNRRFHVDNAQRFHLKPCRCGYDCSHTQTGIDKKTSCSEEKAEVMALNAQMKAISVDDDASFLCSFDVVFDLLVGCGLMKTLPLTFCPKHFCQDMKSLEAADFYLNWNLM